MEAPTTSSNDQATDTSKATSPLASLPQEILNIVFSFVQASSIPTRRINRLPEIIFSQVSTYWRDVALSNPLLWTQVNIRSDASLPRAGEYLRRSNDCVIDILLDLYHADKTARSPVDTTRLVDHSMYLIAAHIQRWRSLIAVTYFEPTMHHLLSHLDGRTASGLERLGIDVDTVSTDAELKPFPGLYPCLRTFRSPDLTCGWPALHGVQSLEITRQATNTPLFTGNAFCNELLSISALTVLSVDASAIVEPPSPLLPIRLPLLRCLKVIGGGSHGLKILWNFDVPVLESIWVEVCDAWDVAELNEIRSGQPKFPSVRYLTMQTYDYLPHPPFTRHMPNVEHIHLSYCWTFNRALTIIAMGNSSSPLWPRLHTIAFRHIRDGERPLAHTIQILGASFKAAGRQMLRLLTDEGIYRYLCNQQQISDSGVWADLVNLDILTKHNFDDPWWGLMHDNNR